MNSETFDLADLISGISYPTDEVVVYMDEATAYDLSKVEEKIAKDPENGDLEKKRQSLLKKAQKSKFTFRIKGVPRTDVLAVLEDLEERFPTEYSFGKAKPNPEQNEAWHDHLWAMYVTEIENPDGAKVEGLSVEDAHDLRRGIPGWAAAKILSGINALADRATKGFENLALETDFLSKR